MLGGATRVARLCVARLFTRCVLQIPCLKKPHVRRAVPLKAFIDRANRASGFLERVRVETGLVLRALRVQPSRLPEQFLANGNISSVEAGRRCSLRRRHVFDTFAV